MSVLRQQNWLGQQRVDVPHLRSLDSAISADFDLLAGSIVSGNKALVVRGFDLVTGSAVSHPATSLQLNVAGGILMHQNASEAGTIFTVLDDATVETLDGTNPNVSGSFTPSQVNYVGLDLVRAADSSTSDLVMFWDSNASDETPKTVPLARTLSYKIVIGTTDFSSTPNVLPIAKVTTDSLNVVTAIEDARQLAFRLGSGGSSPDALNAYAWPQGRNEATATTAFSGGDKAIGSLKDWMDAAMTRLWELGGGEHWYSSTADRNLVLVSTGTTFANGENFSWDGTNLLWQGLQFLFDGSTGWYNEVQSQTATSAGLTDLADGECVYVDLDRTQNLSGTSGLVAAKATLSTLGQGSTPGARQVVAWRRGTSIFTKGSKYPVGAQYTAASTAALGLVKLSKAPADSANPIVLTSTEKNAASGVAALDASSNVVAAGLLRDATLGAGTVSIGTGANDSAVSISKAGALTTIGGALTVSSGDLNLSAGSIIISGTITANGGTGTDGLTAYGGSGGSGNNNGIYGIGHGTGDGVRGEGRTGTISNGVYGLSGSNGGYGGRFAGSGSGMALLADGDGYATGDWKYNAAKTRTLFVPATDFVLDQGGGGAKLLSTSGFSNNVAGFWSNTDGTETDLVAHIKVPAGSTITGVQACFQNKDTVTIHCYANLYVTSLSNTQGWIQGAAFGSVDQVTAAGTAPTWYSSAATTTTIAADGSQWLSAYVGLGGSSAGTDNKRFYGLKITYTQTTVAPHV